MTNETDETTSRPKGSGDEGAGLDVTAVELKRRREELGLTVMDLHKASGIARGALYGYEAGRVKPGLAEIRRLCAVLRMSPNRLIAGSDDVETAQSALQEMLGAGQREKMAIREMVLLSMLAPDEKAAIIKIVMGLVAARYSKQEVEQAMQVVDGLGKITHQVLAAGGVEETAHMLNALSEAAADAKGEPDEVVQNLAAKIGGVAPDSEERARRRRSPAEPKKPTK